MKINLIKRCKFYNGNYNSVALLGLESICRKHGFQVFRDYPTNAKYALKDSYTLLEYLNTDAKEFFNAVKVVIPLKKEDYPIAAYSDALKTVKWLIDSLESTYNLEDYLIEVTK